MLGDNWHNFVHLNGVQANEIILSLSRHFSPIWLGFCCSGISQINKKLYKVSECECFTSFTLRINFSIWSATGYCSLCFQGIFCKSISLVHIVWKWETDIYGMQKLLLSGSCYSVKRETRNLDGWYLNSLIVEGLVEFFLLYSTWIWILLI